MDLINYDVALHKIIELAKERIPGYVCFANVHMTIESYRNIKFAKQVNNATLVLSDGVSLVKYINYFYGYVQERIAGMDIFPDLIRHAELNSLKIFLFGTTQKTLDEINLKIKKEFPGLEIVGLCSPPFDKSLDDEAYIDQINNSKASLVFVALGCPKQETWMATHSHKMNAVLLGVGGAFPVYAGITRRAPVFIQNWGLEWLFRLAQEPRRLFKRYLVTNTLFIYLCLRIKIKSIFTQ